MDKIYSRNRIRLPMFKYNGKYFYNKNENNNKKKFLKIFSVVIIAFITAKLIVQAISPIINKQCINMAKVIATNISNQQATAAMSKYKYEDICIITKDSSRKYSSD